MDVLHLAPPVEASGIGSYADRFRAALREAGADLVTAPRVRGEAHAPRAIRAFVADVRAAARGADVVHAELGGGSLAEFYAALAIERDGDVPVVLTLHEPPGGVWWPLNVAGVRELRLVRRAVGAATVPVGRRLDRRALERAAHLLTLSETGAAAVRRRLGDGAPPVGVLPVPLRFDAAPRRPDRGTFGFFGYWYESKGLETLLDAAALLRARSRPVTLRLFGDVLPDGGRSGRLYRRRVLARAAAEEGIEVRGRIADGDVAAELGRCDAIVLPYLASPRMRDLVSVSAALVDVLGLGIPVVASRVRALPELVRDGENGLLVPPGDAAALADALAAVRDDDGLRARLREGAARDAAALRARDAGAAALAAYRRATT